ncbi:MAG: phosphonate ABC transporter, permease protein PhnE [Desulfobacteraceae bacterium]|nr:MAG: phosphonate ABC transporter, permease protein PhnE [Desulfobacteraceae bacterium]
MDSFLHFEGVCGQMNRSRKKRIVLFAILFLAALIGSSHVAEVSIGRLIEGLPDLFNYIRQTLPPVHVGTLRVDLADWYWGLGKWLSLLVDTILIGFLGTLLGVTGGLLLCFPASRNLMRLYPVYFICRRLLEIARAVPELVYALIFVFAFGLGPVPGVLAIAIHSAGALGKLFSEVNENVDFSSVEGVRAAGGNWFQVIRYAVFPQVLPNFASYALLRFEINVRSAAIIGFVGAGGIGQELFFVIRQFIYTDISAIVLLIILTVSLIDMSCEKLRHRLIGKEALI